MRKDIVLLFTLSATSLSAVKPQQPGAIILNIEIKNSNSNETKQFQVDLKQPLMAKDNWRSFTTTKNIRRLLVGSALFTYGYTYYRIHTMHTWLQKKEGWSCWKNNIPLEQLLATPHVTLVQDLMHDIDIVYKTKVRPIDFMKPFDLFLKDLMYEKSRLTNYISLVTTLKKWHLGFFFPLNDELLRDAEQRIHRISYVNGVFECWALEYKQQQIKKGILFTQFLLQECHQADPIGI